MPHNKEAKEILGLNRITKKRIMELCKKDKLYQTPELNDVLYLHYQGFEFIECLDEYTELKCLWLECNAISEIQGLDKLSKLKCLFLQSNLIRKIENLEYCKELDTLNLSQNHIRKIENCGFEVLPVLNTLNLTSNYLKDYEGLKELQYCTNLSVLDLSNNRIDDILVVKIFAKMPALKVLVLQGNPVVSKIPQYRKTLILECKHLTYLDSRPVFPKDRACAEAWKRGGYEEERKENERWNRKERKKMRDGVNATIQLRNKNRKPEDQISLIPSSDSEDESNTRKKKLQIRQGSEDSRDCIWNEVAEDKHNLPIQQESREEAEDKKSERSSSLDISSDGKSSESFQSPESDSNGEIVESMIEDRDNVESIKEQQMPEKEIKLDSERILETGKPELSSTILTKLDEDIDFQEIIENTTKSENCLKSSGKKVQLHIENIKSLDEIADSDPSEKYQPIIEAIKNITKSEEDTGSILNKNIENLNKNETNDDDNYEPLQELEETMNILLKPETDKQLSSHPATKNEQLELENEQERLKVNLQLKTDFEELTTNLNAFVKQLDKDQEKRQEVIKALFNKNTAAKESSSESSSDSEEKVSLERQKFENMIDQWDRDSRLKTGNKEYKDEELIKETETTDINKDLRGSSDGKQICEPNQDEEKSEITINKKMFGSMDISLLTQKSNEALNSLEKESKELKRLLQQLENKNEDLFKDINKEVNCQSETESQENRVKEIAEVPNKNVENQALDEDKSMKAQHNETKADLVKQKTVKEGENIKEGLEQQDQQEIVYIIIEELLKSLELKEKSYEFPDPLEYQEDKDILPPQHPTIFENIPEFVESFNQFYKTIETKNLSLENHKSLALKALCKQPNLKQFNNDTLQTLDDQLEQIKREQHKKVRRMVDRVYAQKERYNDTLELFDGKLMVRNKDTQELRELPQPGRQDSTDSETDYDTAQSEEENEDCSKIKKNLKGDQKLCRPYKPTARKSSEDLIVQALIANKTNRAADDSEEESTEEYYSLDTQNSSNLYNIDREFFNKLTLENLNLSQTDENHIVQCARSYEELKHCLTLSKEERSLTEEENELLENMIESKCVKLQENPENLLEIEQINKQLSKEELKITLKSQEPISLPSVKEDFKKVKLKSSNEAIQLFEYKYDSNEKSLENTGQRTPTTEDELVKNSDKLMKTILLNTLAEKKEKFQKENLNIERQSEEEKNKIESNIDVESAASNIKATGEGHTNSQPEQFTVAGDILGDPLREGTAETINDFSSNDVIDISDSGDIEVLECNLEIIGCNDELVDTITVNAEIHF
ncbi:dynein axonemal assembly factor 1 homolog [Calliphora vicina]|uniref:dynein axonemal assembly factor 1 homolog n=1 Tax=Calliphora vicina TaxID=7373 RepID=UPI00325B2AB2